MALSQSIDDAREERIGRHGVTATAFADALAHTGKALAAIRARHADGKLPLLRLPEKTDDLAGTEAAAKRLPPRGRGDTVSCAAGGGALRPGPPLHFMDNLDPGTYAALLAQLPLASTRFVAVSKSGGTGE